MKNYQPDWRFFYFSHKPIRLKHSPSERLRKIGQKSLSSPALLRLEWLIFYQTVGKRNAAFTSRHFGISRKTLHKWLKRFKESHLKGLEDQPKTPLHKRTWMISPEQVERVIDLRKRYPKYGKKKLRIKSCQKYQEEISTWKIERVIRRHQLYFDKQEHQLKLKRQKARIRKPKIRIKELMTKVDCAPGTLWHTDSVHLWWYGRLRVIFTALEDKTKLGFARVYQSGSSRSAKDFLERLVFLTNQKIKIIHSDNGSEFAGEFEKVCYQLQIQQVYSRVRQPKDNPCLERFNWTIQDEWLSLSEIGLDELNQANLDLTSWLIEYNAERPHEALDYQTPLQYAQDTYFKVLPMWSASTRD